MFSTRLLCNRHIHGVDLSATIDLWMLADHTYNITTIYAIHSGLLGPQVNVCLPGQSAVDSYANDDQSVMIKVCCVSVAALRAREALTVIVCSEL